MIIGLSGYARAGKDEVASVLVNDFGFTRVAYADKLRDVLYALNPIVEIEHYVYDDKYLERYPVQVRYVQDVIDRFGWDGYKETSYGDEIRRLLQRLGTEAGRQILGENIWVESTMNNLPSDKVVITDCRFPNEFDAVKNAGGVMVRIARPGTIPVNGHISETALDNHNFDYAIVNDSSLEDLHEIVRLWYKERIV